MPASVDCVPSGALVVALQIVFGQAPQPPLFLLDLWFRFVLGLSHTKHRQAQQVLVVIRAERPLCLQICSPRCPAVFPPYSQAGNRDCSRALVVIEACCFMFVAGKHCTQRVSGCSICPFVLIPMLVSCLQHAREISAWVCLSPGLHSICDAWSYVTAPRKLCYEISESSNFEPTNTQPAIEWQLPGILNLAHTSNGMHECLAGHVSF